MTAHDFLCEIREEAQAARDYPMADRIKDFLATHQDPYLVLLRYVAAVAATEGDSFAFSVSPPCDMGELAMTDSDWDFISDLPLENAKNASSKRPDWARGWADKDGKSMTPIEELAAAVVRWTDDLEDLIVEIKRREAMKESAEKNLAKAESDLLAESGQTERFFIVGSKVVHVAPGSNVKVSVIDATRVDPTFSQARDMSTAQ